MGICQPGCRWESNSTRHRASMPPRWVSWLLPSSARPPPASLLHLALFSLQWNSSFPQTCTSPRAKKKPGQVICGERLKIHSRAKTTVFMDLCCDKQPSPSDCMTNGVFLPFQSTCRLTLGAAAPWHLSNFLLDINVALGFIPLFFFFSWPLLRVRVSLIEGQKVQLWV